MNKYNFDYTEIFLSPFSLLFVTMFRRRPLEVILWETVMKLCSKLTGKLPCRSVISVALDRLILKPGFRPWTRTLVPKTEKPGPWKTCPLKNLDPENLDPEKPGSWKTWEAAGCKKKQQKKKWLEDHIV